MTEQQLLDAMNYLDDRQIASAGARLFPISKSSTSHRRILSFRRFAAAAAAVLILTASFLTALAASENFRNLVFDFFRIGQAETVPDGTAPSDDRPIAQNAEKITIGGVIEGTYVHAPASGLARNGAFYICTDTDAMHSGNHYDIYTEQNGQYSKAEIHTFSQVYTLHGNEFHVEFEWAEVNGQCCCAYVDSEVPWRKPNLAGPVEATLFWFTLHLQADDGSSYTTNYPVLIDLRTGELTDMLAGTGAENIPDLYQAAISPDRTRLLMVDWDRNLYYADIPAGKLYSLDELSGEHAENCCLTDSTVTCWSLNGDSIEDGTLGSYKIWAIDLNTLERRDLYAGIPATPATSYDVWSNSYQIAEENPEIWERMGGKTLDPLGTAGLYFLSGFDRSSHSGNMYCGSKFAIEVDGQRNVYVIDLSDGSRSVIDGFIWPEADYPSLECIPSPDGEKLLIQWRSSPTYYDYIGVLDFPQRSYTEFSRENPNAVNEHTIYWYDNSSIVIATSDRDAMQDYYIYRLLK